VKAFQHHSSNFSRLLRRSLRLHQGLHRPSYSKVCVCCYAPVPPSRPLSCRVPPEFAAAAAHAAARAESRRRADAVYSARTKHLDRAAVSLSSSFCIRQARYTNPQKPHGPEGLLTRSGPCSQSRPNQPTGQRRSIARHNRALDTFYLHPSVSGGICPLLNHSRLQTVPPSTPHRKRSAADGVRETQ
jgi:hypothetical protein